MQESYTDITNEISKDELYFKLRSLGKDYFQNEFLKSKEQFRVLKDYSKLYSYNLPNAFNEFYINYDEIGQYLTLDIPFLKQLDDYYKQRITRMSSIGGEGNIKDIFTKWALTQNKREKNYHSRVCYSAIEKETNRLNINNLFYIAAIVVSNKEMFSYEKAIECLTKVNELVPALKLDDPIKQEIYYYSYLFSGMILQNNNRFEESNKALYDSLQFRPQGINSRFYLAINEIALDHMETARYLIKDIIINDVQKAEYSLSINHFGLFNYFIKNLTLYNFFHIKEFSLLSNYFHELIEELFDGNKIEYDSIKKVAAVMKDLPYQDSLAEESIKMTTFLNYFAKYFENSKNRMVLLLGKKINEKIDSLVESLITSYSNILEGNTQESLETFDIQESRLNEAINHLSFELEKTKATSTEKATQSRERIEHLYTEEYKNVEKQLNNLSKNPNYDPFTSFSTSMAYTLILSFIVFLIGGFAGYSNTASGETSFSIIIGGIIVAGFKWAVITFLIGVVVSAVFAAMVLIDRSTIKQNLTTRLNSIKNKKERELNAVQKANEVRLKAIIQNFTEQIENQKLKIQDLNKKREAEVARQNAINKEATDKERERILSLLK